MDFNLLFKSSSTYCGPAAAVWLVQASRAEALKCSGCSRKHGFLVRESSSTSQKQQQQKQYYSFHSSGQLSEERKLAICIQHIVVAMKRGYGEKLLVGGDSVTLTSNLLACGSNGGDCHASSHLTLCAVVSVRQTASFTRKSCLQ